MKRLRHIERLFPNLMPGDYLKYSASSARYNCLAYAAGDMDHWWDVNHFWPAAMMSGGEVDDLVRAYMSQGFRRCTDGRPRRGYEKIAIYASGTQWTHAARLRDDGWWESKIGRLQDIIHRTAENLTGGDYGSIALFMKRELAKRVEYLIGYRGIPPCGLNYEGPP